MIRQPHIFVEHCSRSDAQAKPTLALL